MQGNIQNGTDQPCKSRDPREEGWSAQSMQERNNFVAVFHPYASNFVTDAPKMNLPRLQ